MGGVLAIGLGVDIDDLTAAVQDGTHYQLYTHTKRDQPHTRMSDGAGAGVGRCRAEWMSVWTARCRGVRSVADEEDNGEDGENTAAHTAGLEARHGERRERTLGFEEVTQHQYSDSTNEERRVDWFERGMERGQCGMCSG